MPGIKAKSTLKYLRNPTYKHTEKEKLHDRINQMV